MNENDIIEMLGGFAQVKEIRKGRSMISENPIELVLNGGYMNIGNLEALRSRGFEFLGCGITDDGHLYLSMDVKLPKMRELTK